MEAFIRPGTALAVFVLFAALEFLAPDRARERGRVSRWSGPVVLTIVSTAAARLLLPLGLAGAAVWARQNEVGLLYEVVWPGWADFVVGLLVLDLAVWAQHVATHKVGFLWRLHRVHHTDPEVDVMTAFRFHPGEIVLSLAWKAAVVVAMGIPPEVAFWYEVMLNAAAQFNHANIKLPRWLEGPLRLVVVTPAMHRVHHSIDRREADHNYGNSLSIWDRLFKTYRADFEAGPKTPLGTPYWRSRGDLSVVSLLIQPFLPQPAESGDDTSQGSGGK